MDDSDNWQAQKSFEFQSKNVQNSEQILKMFQTLKKMNINQIQFQAMYVSDYKCKKFLQLYEQQLKQQFSYYFQNEIEQSSIKFFTIDKKLKNNPQFDIKLLRFRTYQQRNIFEKFYQGRLRQLQIQHQYQLQTHKNFISVYYPKGETFSTFFMNQISEMMLKLQSYYCYDKRVIDKIRYSEHFNRLIEKNYINAQFYRRDYGANYAIFYSNKYQRKQIIQIINYNLLENITILNFWDKKQCQKVNQIMFCLLVQVYDQIIQKIMKQEDILIEKNHKYCKILIHDRYPCFDMAKKQIQQNLSNVRLFKLQGANLREIKNRLVRRCSDFPFLRLKFIKKSIYCAINTEILRSNELFIKNFSSFMEDYFQNLSYSHKILFYMGIIRNVNKNHMNFLNQVEKLTTNTSIYIDQYEKLIMQKQQKYSMIILNVKEFSQFTIGNTKKEFYSIFMTLLTKKPTKDKIQFSNKFQKDIKYEPIVQQIKKQDTISYKFQQKELQTSYEQEPHQNQNFLILPQILQEQKQKNHQKNKKQQKIKQKQKVIEPIELKYPYLHPKQNTAQTKYWQAGQRQKLLQRKLQTNYTNQLKGFKFKIFKLILKNNIQIQQNKSIDQQRLYFSISIEKNNKLSPQFISINDIKQIHSTLLKQKQKKIFIFYKTIDEQVYLPCYVIDIL